MTVHLWRVAADTQEWSADDLTDKGAAVRGARWNHPGEHVAYAATSISLAAWETRAHVARGESLPWNRFLVRIDVPDEVWAARTTLARPLPTGWEAIPEGLVSRRLGSAWLKSRKSLLLMVPSVIVPEEYNVLLSPMHADHARLSAVKLRRFVFDARV